MYKSILSAFGEAVRIAEEYNHFNKMKRFIPMTQYKEGSDVCTEVGIYDYKTKKYVLFDVRAHNALELSRELTEMVRKSTRKWKTKGSK